MSTQTDSQTESTPRPPFFGPTAQAMLAGFVTRVTEIKARQSEIEGVPDDSVDDGERDRLRAEHQALTGESEMIEKVMGVVALLTQADGIADELVRPAIKVAAEAARPLSADVADVLRILFVGGMDIVENLEPERTRHYGITARGRKGKFDAYVKAGFTKQQAFAMVLAEIKPVDPASLVNKTSSASDKAKKKSG